MATEDGKLWQAAYTTEKGWSPGVAFADHAGAVPPALAQVGRTLHCVYRNANRDAAPVALHWATCDLATADELPPTLKRFPEAYISTSARDATPTLADDNGTLRLVYTASQPRACYEMDFRQRDATVMRGQWSGVREHPQAGTGVMSPTLAVFNGAVHMIYMDVYNAKLRHLVRGSDDEWKEVTAADGSVITPPELVDLKADAWDFPDMGLAAHDGQLHLMFRFGSHEHHLVHCQFDGTTWHRSSLSHRSTPDGPIIGMADSRAGAALASYDGKLHAVYSPRRSVRLRHATWTKTDGWSKPVALDGHESSGTPALLVLKQGTAGAERESLVLVHQGIER